MQPANRKSQEINTQVALTAIRAIPWGYETPSKLPEYDKNAINQEIIRCLQNEVERKKQKMVYIPPLHAMLFGFVTAFLMGFFTALTVLYIVQG